MGWNSWNCWAAAVDQEKVLSSAHAMVSSGLINHGWTYINIDDAWQGTRDPQTHALQPDAKKFPDIKAMCEEIHGMGLKTGLYSTPWVRSYAGRLGGSAENAEGAVQTFTGPAVRNKKVLPYAIGKFHFADVDAKQWAAWGIDYLKYDWGPVEAPEAREMAEALRASGRDVVYSLSNNSVGNVIQVAPEISKIANAWRTTKDITDNWGRVQEIGFSQAAWAEFQSPGHYNDADMLVVGFVGWGPRLHFSKLTPDEQYTHLTLWSLLSAPLLIGCDLARLDPFTLNLLTNDEVLAIDQDSLVKPARLAKKEGEVQVYVKKLEDGSRAVGFFNLGSAAASYSPPWQELGMAAGAQARDLWRQKELGGLPASVSINAHGTLLLKVTGTVTGGK